VPWGDVRLRIHRTSLVHSQSMADTGVLCRSLLLCLNKVDTCQGVCSTEKSEGMLSMPSFFARLG